MSSFQASVEEYRKQLEMGEIQKGYKGLMEYTMGLRTYFKNKYPCFLVSGMYQGYMDMTYFSLSSQSLKQRNLKIPIVFLHENFRFEVWLSGSNKRVQEKYWELFKKSGWKKYRLVSTTKGNDSILEYVLIDNPDFSDLDAITEQIEERTLKFIKDIEIFLSAYEN
jgi:hypothetical protein